MSELKDVILKISFIDKSRTPTKAKILRGSNLQLQNEWSEGVLLSFSSSYLRL